jgi:hypothetical protein
MISSALAEGLGVESVTRHWLLPAACDVLVQEGAHVVPDDRLARCAGAGAVRGIDISAALEDNGAVSAGAVRVYPGEQVEAGATLFSRRRGWLGHDVVRAPIAGEVLGWSGGSLFLRERRPPLDRFATLLGEVEEVADGRGVVVRAPARRVHGIWGGGGERRGRIELASCAPEDTLAWRQVRPRHSGAILVAGVLDDPCAVRRAHSLHVRGIVVGSAPLALREFLEDAPLPVVITEGWGRLPMASPVYALLRRHRGQAAAIVGAAAWPGEGAMLYLQPTEDEARGSLDPLIGESGAAVRLTGGSHLGELGRIVGRAPFWDRTPLGAWAEGAEVRLESGRQAFVPLANLEALE